MIYFITGGAGFIGTNFIYYMFQKYGGSVRVINIDKLTYAGNLVNLHNLTPTIIREGNYVFEQVDICDSEKINQLFKKYRPDYVINFAAESHVDRSISNPHLFLNSNVIGTQVLLNAALNYGIKRFHQVSTDEVYGTLGKTGYFTEETPLAPRSPYSASKASADLLVQAYFETYQLPITISRCSNNYGPYQFPEKLIPLMIKNILDKKTLPVYGDGENVRDWLHVNDHCSAIDLIVHKDNVDGEVYNIGGNNEWSNIELVKLIIHKMNEICANNNITFDLIQFVKDRKGHDFRYAIDNSKIKKELDWEPTVSFEIGIHETIKWYINNQQWMKKVIGRGNNKNE